MTTRKLKCFIKSVVSSKFKSIITVMNSTHTHIHTHTHTHIYIYIHTVWIYAMCIYIVYINGVLGAVIARATKCFKHPYIYPIYTFPFNFDFSGGNSLLFTLILISGYSRKPRDLMSSWGNILNIFSFHLLWFYEKIYGNGKKSDYRKRAYLKPYLKMRPKVMESNQTKKGT